MILLLDIGNTHTHAGIARGKRITPHDIFPTKDWQGIRAKKWLQQFIGKHAVSTTTLCSVVPAATRAARTVLRELGLKTDVITHRNCGLETDYPKPSTIGPDRRANARAGIEYFGAPVVIIDFGTAVTFDIVDAQGRYIGGIIAPGLSAMTDYLHEKTALLPRIEIRDANTAIGKSTEQAMRIGAVHGYRGLINGLIGELRRELKVRKLPVIATGGASKIIARQCPEINAVRPLLTLEGLRLASVHAS
jgi:type III pantothenate kinase